MSAFFVPGNWRSVKNLHVHIICPCRSASTNSVGAQKCANCVLHKIYSFSPVCSSFYCFSSVLVLYCFSPVHFVLPFSSAHFASIFSPHCREKSPDDMCLCRATLHKHMIDAQEDRLCHILQTANCILQTACILSMDTLPIAKLHILFTHTAHICHKCIFLAIFALIYIHNAQCTQHSLRCIIYSAHRPYYVQCTMYSHTAADTWMGRQVHGCRSRYWVEINDIHLE